MTGPEHYKAAEDDLAEMGGKSIAGVNVLLARAQVHATLALTAATALPVADFDEWHAAAAGEVTA